MSSYAFAENNITYPPRPPVIFGGDNKTIGKNFAVYDAMRFREKPNLYVLGLQPIKVVYMSELWPGKKVESEPNIAFLDKFFSSKEFSGFSIVCLDVEGWPVDIRQNSRQEVNNTIRRFQIILDRFKKAQPNVLVGFYGIPPVRDYYAPVQKQGIEQWHEANLQWSPIGNAVDVIYPSLYSFSEDEDAWRAYAISNIEEAKVFKKKVIPFLWPQYHNRNPILKDRLIDGKFWRAQLDIVYQNADGVVIWSPYTNAGLWGENSAWWLETKEFIGEHNGFGD
jgi:hypothetical protein